MLFTDSNTQSLYNCNMLTLVLCSVYGAHQLQLDFGYVRTWLQTAIQHPEVRQSVLSLDVFKYLDGIISLLKRQPKGRSSSRPPPARSQYSADDNSKSGLILCWN